MDIHLARQHDPTVTCQLHPSRLTHRARLDSLARSACCVALAQELAASPGSRMNYTGQRGRPLDNERPLSCELGALNRAVCWAIASNHSYERAGGGRN